MLTTRRATAKRIMLTSRSVVACHGGRFSRGLFSKATSLSAAAEDLTPEKIVAALDKHIVGQSDAKVAVAIALRDQWRRQQLDVDFQRETLPNNILMVGPTGVGKTEVARREHLQVRADTSGMYREPAQSASAQQRLQQALREPMSPRTPLARTGVPSSGCSPGCCAAMNEQPSGAAAPEVAATHVTEALLSRYWSLVAAIGSSSSP